MLWFAEKGRVTRNVKLTDWKTASAFCFPREGKKEEGVGASPSGRRCCSSTGIKDAGGDIRAGHRRTGGATGLLEAIGLITENFKRNSTVAVSQGLPKKEKKPSKTEKD